MELRECCSFFKNYAKKGSLSVDDHEAADDDDEAERVAAK